MGDIRAFASKTRRAESMRVLQVYDFAPELEGPTEGVGLAILQLSQALSSLGNEVWILGGMGRRRERVGRAGDVVIRRADRFGLMRRTWSPSNLSLSRQILFPPIVMSQRDLLKEISSFDVVHGHVYSAGFVALRIGALLDVPVCNTIHGSYYEVWDRIANPRLAPVIRFAERRIVSYLARNVDCQIHTDRFFADMVRSWGVDHDRLRVIHNGVTDELLNNYTEPAHRDIPMFFTARRLVLKSGVDFLLKAFAIVLRQRKAILRIAGGGPEYENLLALADRLQIRNSVEFLGVISHDRIPQFIGSGTVGVLPSLAEASSLFLLECMAIGRPVVCSAAGGITEIVDSQTAWMVRPGDERSLADGMIQSIDQWDDSVSKARKAHKQAEQRHSWSGVARRTIECYRRS